MTTLFVNACLRGEQSRTLALCREYLASRAGVKEIDLGVLRLQPLYAEDVARRAELQRAGDFSDPMFDLAKEFADAGEIVIGAPYWDLSFPAALKVYIEHVSVCDIAFRYTEEGQAIGTCKAKSLTYITTGGGEVSAANFGYEYLCGIARMFGIPEVRFVAAENLDVWGMDVEQQLGIARAQMQRLL